MRPRTLAEVAQPPLAAIPSTAVSRTSWVNFMPVSNAAALSPTPELLAPRLGELGRVPDAYLAATAEQLSCANGFPVPAWVTAEDRKLHRPWFASPLAALRAVLLLENPAAFRSRNLFISENALART